MIDRRTPFGSDDLPPAADVTGDLRGPLALGRELEALSAEPTPPLAADWTDGVMAAIATEPTPQPVVVAGNALRAGRPMALLAAIADAWRVGFGAGRPALVRAPALALVLVALVAVGSVVTIGGYAGGRALGLFPDAAPPVVPVPTPTPTPTAPPTPVPTRPPSPSPSPSSPPATATPSRSAPPTATSSPSRAGETESPSASSDDHGGSSGSGSDDSGSGSGNSGSGSSGSGSGRSGSGSDDSGAP